MSNLKVTIVVRTKGPDGKRGWVRATGKNDPVGPLYLRYYKSSSPKHIKTGRFYDEAEVAKLRLERKLRASSMGIDIPQEHEKGTNLHHWRDCLNSYVEHLRKKTKRNGWKYKDKSIREREANILEFTRLINKPFVENYTTADTLRYKEHLYGLGRKNDTVLNKLSCIVTWLKRNGLVSIIGLLPADERPDRREPEGHPFTRAEVDQMMEVAGEHKPLLRLAFNSGMRKMELAHAERSDIDKTAGVQPPINSRADWVHRWRDTTATRQLEAGILRDRDLNRYMGWEGQGNNHSPMLEHYARYSPFDSPEVRNAANLLDPYPEKAGPRLVRNSA